MAPAYWGLWDPDREGGVGTRLITGSQELYGGQNINGLPIIGAGNQTRVYAAPSETCPFGNWVYGTLYPTFSMSNAVDDYNWLFGTCRVQWQSGYDCRYVGDAPLYLVYADITGSGPQPNVYEGLGSCLRLTVNWDDPYARRHGWPTPALYNPSGYWPWTTFCYDS